MIEIESTDCAIKLLHSVSLFLITATNSIQSFDALNQLTELLKKHSTSSNGVSKTRSIGVISLVTTMKVLNNNLSGLKDNQCFYISDYKRIRTKYLNENMRPTIAIFEFLKGHILNKEKDDNIPLLCFFKSVIYQSLCQLISSNSNLAPNIAEFLYAKLDNLIVIGKPESNGSDPNQLVEKLGGYSDSVLTQPNTLVYFNLNKCVNGNGEFRLVEPVDVLFHCADLCARSSLRYNNVMVSATRLSNLIKSISNTYVKREAKFMFDRYKNQVSEKVGTNALASATEILHQVQMGVLDSLIENLVELDLYHDVETLLDRSEATNLLFCQEIESIIHKKKEKVVRLLVNRSRLFYNTFI